MKPTAWRVLVSEDFSVPQQGYYPNVGRVFATPEGNAAGLIAMLDGLADFTDPDQPNFIRAPNGGSEVRDGALWPRPDKFYYMHFNPGSYLDNNGNPLLTLVNDGYFFPKPANWDNAYTYPPPLQTTTARYRYRATFGLSSDYDRPFLLLGSGIRLRTEHVMSGPVDEIFRTLDTGGSGISAYSGDYDVAAQVYCDVSGISFYFGDTQRNIPLSLPFAMEMEFQIYPDGAVVEAAGYRYEHEWPTPLAPDLIAEAYSFPPAVVDNVDYFPNTFMSDPTNILHPRRGGLGFFELSAVAPSFWTANNNTFEA